MPDFGLYSWPEALGPKASSWHEIRRASLERERGLAARIGKADLGEGE
jgi:hypothetical protein